jgi:hypothetical protein
VIEKDQSLALQNQECLTDWETGDAKFRRQVVLRDLAPGHQSTVQDGGADLVRHVENHRLPFNRFHV